MKSKRRRDILFTRYKLRQLKKTPTCKSLFAILLLSLGIFAVSCSNDIEQFDNDGIEIGTEERNTLATRSANNGGDVIVDVSKIPNIDTIMVAKSVVDQAAIAWNLTINDAIHNDKRVEYGFWIYYDFELKEIYCGRIKPGTDTAPGQVAEYHHIKPDEHRKYSMVCADFHTHPPLFCQPNVAEKPVGPSHRTENDDDDYMGDEEVANAWGLPGIVCDFVRPVYSKDSVGVDYKLYPYGPPKRTASCNK